MRIDVHKKHKNQPPPLRAELPLAMEEEDDNDKKVAYRADKPSSSAHSPRVPRLVIVALLGIVLLGLHVLSIERDDDNRQAALVTTTKSTTATTAAAVQAAAAVDANSDASIWYKTDQSHQAAVLPFEAKKEEEAAPLLKERPPVPEKVAVPPPPPPEQQPQQKQQPPSSVRKVEFPEGFPVVTEFNDRCILMTPLTTRRLQEEKDAREESDAIHEDHNVAVTKESANKEDDNGDGDDDDNYDMPASAPHVQEKTVNGVVIKRKKKHAHRDKSYGGPDNLMLGRCRFDYAQRVPPPRGFLDDIDYFFFRPQSKDGLGRIVPSHEEREACLAYCVTQLEPHERNVPLLATAAEMGLEWVSKILVQEYKVNPLEPVEIKGTAANQAIGGKALLGRSPIQEAYRGGHAAIVKAMLDGIQETIDVKIDKYGRSLKDYLMFSASPIRPKDAKKYFNLDTSAAVKLQPPASSSKSSGLDPIPDYLQWNTTSSRVASDRCDFDVIDIRKGMPLITKEQFLKDYYMPGRPLVIKGVFSDEELKLFGRSRWEAGTTDFTPDTEVVVGPTGYPSLSGQTHCEVDQTIADLEQSKECADMPGVPMLHSRHPKPIDWEQLYPPTGNYMSGGWNMLERLFTENPERFHSGWQVFFGGDGSGATLHWHAAALNVLYAGYKEWTVTPPRYRGFTGMPSKKVVPRVDADVSLKCTQGPGDLIFIPDYWGHLTWNVGFTIGAAIIPNKRLRDFVFVPSPTESENNINNAREAFKQDFKTQLRAGLPGLDKMAVNARLRQATAATKPKVTDPKILFVHINKTGGTSMIRMLEQNCKGDYTKERWPIGHRTFHATAHAQIEHYGRAAWDAAYTFAIVRHPFARQVSNFFFLLGRCQIDYSGLCAARRVPKDFTAETDEEKIQAFHEYTHNLYEMYPPGSPDHYLFGSGGHGNEQYPTMNATQTSWLVDPEGKIVVKKIFKLENLSRDMHEMSDSIECLNKNKATANQRGLREVFDSSAADMQEEMEEFEFEQMERAMQDQQQHRALGEERKELEMVHINQTPKYPALELFGKNERTIEIIREVYAVDFQNFDYEMP